MIRLAAAVVALCALVLSGCGRAEGVDETRRALEDAGYLDVGIELRARNGVGVARVDAAPGGPPADTAAGVVWRTLPVRFDQLIVALGDASTAFSYEELGGRLGPRDPRSTASRSTRRSSAAACGSCWRCPPAPSRRSPWWW